MVVTEDLRAVTLFDLHYNDYHEVDGMTIAANSKNALYQMPTGTVIDMTRLPLMNLWNENLQESHMIADTNNDPRILGEAKTQIEASNNRRMVIVPIYGEEHTRVNSVMLISWTTSREFSEYENAIYRALPSLLTPVVDNLRLIKNLAKNLVQLQAANRIAQENARLKSEFLATMSHELRTPLNAVEGFTSIMLNGMGGATYNASTERYLTKVQANSKRLLSLINDFLDLSRIESGRLEIARLPFNPTQLARKWQTELSVLAEQKHLALTVDIPADMPTTLYGDEESISKIAINILGNAIKFTDSGSVSLTLGHHDGHWTFSVHDTGIGIPPHAREYIFDEFRQVDQTSKRRFGGSGLGLAIVQKMLRAMHGTVTVQSELGQGSTFTVTLPAQTTM